jgi:molybdate/tungstate transport system permease protein
MSRPGPRSEASRPWQRVAAVLGALLLLYYLVPLVTLVLAEPPDRLLRAIASPRVRSAAVTSLAAATGSTLLATVLGVPLAYWLARREDRLGTLVTAVVLLPLVLPPIVSGVLLLTIVGPGSPLGAALAGVGIRIPGTLAGTVLAQTFVASPFVVVTGRAAFASVDRDLERASLSLGQSQGRTLRHVVLPLAWPGLLAGVVLAFARSMGEFGATLMVAYYPQTLPVEIWDAFRALGLDAAMPVAVVLVGVAVLTLLSVTAVGRSTWT